MEWHGHVWSEREIIRDCACDRWDLSHGLHYKEDQCDSRKWEKCGIRPQNARSGMLWGWMRRVILQTICWRKTLQVKLRLWWSEVQRKRRTKVLSTPSTFPLCALSRPVKTLVVGVLACSLFIWLKCWKQFQGNDFIIILCAFILLTRASRHQTSQRSWSSGLKIRLIHLDEFKSEAFSAALGIPLPANVAAMKAEGSCRRLKLQKTSRSKSEDARFWKQWLLPEKWGKVPVRSQGDD